MPFAGTSLSVVMIPVEWSLGGDGSAWIVQCMEIRTIGNHSAVTEAPFLGWRLMPVMQGADDDTLRDIILQTGHDHLFSNRRLLPVIVRGGAAAGPWDQVSFQRADGNSGAVFMNLRDCSDAGHVPNLSVMIIHDARIFRFGRKR